MALADAFVVPVGKESVRRMKAQNMQLKEAAIRGYMDEVTCSLCGAVLKNEDAAYGLTRGTIDDGCLGFRMDFDSDWDIYCAGCMNEIDRIFSDFRHTRSK